MKYFRMLLADEPIYPLSICFIANDLCKCVKFLQVLDWLQSIESRVTRLQPVAVDLEVLKRQQEELRPLAKEYRDYAITIEKVPFFCRLQKIF